MNKPFKNNKKGFTVAEVLVASAIFMLFSGALFSIYRMGTRMYISGSWKYNRQKQAERFFEILKGRIEQSSDITLISLGGKGSSINKADTYFASLPNNTVVSSGSSEKRIASFVVAKPIIKNGSTYQREGAVIGHALVLVTNPKTQSSSLELRVQRGINHLGNNYPSLELGSIQLSDYNRISPSVLGVAPVPGVHKLEDVKQVTVGYSEGIIKPKNPTPGENEIKSPLYGLKILMVNPKHASTQFELGFSAKLDSSVEYKEVPNL